MQYTGLKDKHGKEIYEGDILRNLGKKDWYGGEQGIVEYGEFGFTLDRQKRISNKDINYIDWDGEWLGCDFEGNAKDCEVVGNIYENEELLNES